MALVFGKEMDNPEFVKVIPVVLLIVERLSRSVGKIPAQRIRFFGHLVQLFGGSIPRLNSAAVEGSGLRRAPYFRGRASGFFYALLPCAGG
jgi:hypothetical protein